MPADKRGEGGAGLGYVCLYQVQAGSSQCEAPLPPFVCCGPVRSQLPVNPCAAHLELLGRGLEQLTAIQRLRAAALVHGVEADAAGGAKARHGLHGEGQAREGLARVGAVHAAWGRGEGGNEGRGRPEVNRAVQG
jgi:hypothetical protein